MKKIILILAISISQFPFFKIKAQSPQAISYQAGAHNSSGNPMINETILLRFTVHNGTSGGTVVYSETQNATTNFLGSFSLNIGEGAVVAGNFSTINWGGGSKFLQVELYDNTINSYVDMGTSQMFSVPYSLFSTNSLNSWNLNGNTGTSSAINFIGTVDAQPLMIKVNNTISGFIDYDLAKSNTGFGYQSLFSNTTGYGNLAMGYRSLSNNTTGFENTANGFGSLHSNSTGNANTANGYRALYYNTTGGGNNAIGDYALYQNTTGYGNTANGTLSLFYSSIGNNNTASGFYSLYYNNTGDNNIASGTNALFYNTAGNNNVAYGVNALYLNTTGTNNTGLGTFADVTIGTLTNATAIGYNSKVSASNSLVLGGTGADAVNVGVGTTNPQSKLTISGGDVNITDIANGIIMKSPNGNCWRVTIDDTGNLIRTSITCP